MRPEDCLQHGMQLTFFVAGDVRSIMLNRPLPRALFGLRTLQREQIGGCWTLLSKCCMTRNMQVVVVHEQRGPLPDLAQLVL